MQRGQAFQHQRQNLISIATWLLILLAFLPAYTFGQSPVVSPKDSLVILGALYEKTHQEKPELAIAYSQKSLRISRSINDKSSEAKALFWSGSSYKNLRQLDSAKVYLSASVVLYKELNDQKGYGEALVFLGEAYFVNGEFVKAMEQFKAATKVLQNEKPLLRRALNGLANVHGNLDKIPEAINYLKQALAIAEELGDLPAKSICYNNLGSMHFELKEYEQALEYFKSTVEIQQILHKSGLTKPGDDKLIDAYWQVGRTYTVLGKYPEAEKNLNLSIARAKEAGDKYKEIGATWYLAEYHSKQKEYLKAIELLKSTEKAIADNRYDWLYREYFERVADQYKLAGREKESLEYKERYVAFTDSLLRLKELEGVAIAKGPAEDSLQLQKAEPSFMNSIISADKKKFWWMLFGTTLFICSTYMLWRYKKKQPDADNTMEPLVEAQAQSITHEFITPEQPATMAPLKYVQAVKHSGEVIVPIETIYWFETKDKKYFLSDGEELLETHHTIAELENMLAGNENFIRINRSVIINAYFMFNYSPWEKDKYIVRMQDKAKTEFSMPRNRMKAMRQQFGLEPAAV
ncbi:tetratricopeptide repeat protein [Pontibacter cellulosilyticus]|uniref:LytTR family transcriptional regulator n=1 Tax=Pontibacter cellulosilyticus TaxID=1720253 RepID=A0A923N8Q2_9BACT|nr:tetratricopeptide repeat protein [Pontibacter cellulosilyticus]MBC5994873.1 LytTR family transcriptional regulator [Pontibacter cellulosilyticus]